MVEERRQEQSDLESTSARRAASAKFDFGNCNKRILLGAIGCRSIPDINGNCAVGFPAPVEAGTDTGGHEKACTGTARQARPVSGKYAALHDTNAEQHREICSPLADPRDEDTTAHWCTTLAPTLQREPTPAGLVPRACVSQPVCGLLT